MGRGEAMIARFKGDGGRLGEQCVGGCRRKGASSKCRSQERDIYIRCNQLGKRIKLIKARVGTIRKSLQR